MSSQRKANKFLKNYQIKEVAFILKNKILIICVVMAFLAQSAFAENRHFKFIMQNAKKGDSGAQFLIGYAYVVGDGVKINYKEGIKWLQKSAKQGHAVAQSFLGDMYLRGIGVKKDYKKAVSWYSKAVAQGNYIAQRNLGVMYYLGKGVKENKATAFSLFQKAAYQEDAEAEYLVGAMYLDGDGVRQNYSEAVKWFKRAAEHGKEDAVEILNQLRYAEEQSRRQAALQDQRALEQLEALSILGSMFLGGMDDNYGYDNNDNAKDTKGNCSDCNGTGKCEQCGGDGVLAYYSKCDICHGTGNCQRCRGTGHVGAIMDWTW